MFPTGNIVCSGHSLVGCRIPLDGPHVFGQPSPQSFLEFNAELASLPAIVSSTWGRNRINDSMTKVDLEAGTGLKNFVRAEQRKGSTGCAVGVLAV